MIDAHDGPPLATAATTDLSSRSDVTPTLPTGTVRTNVAANFIGKAAAAVLNIAFVPLWMNQMGVESYGLVGALTTILALFAVFDFGLSTTLNRELASQSTRKTLGSGDLIRTVEAVYWVVGLALGTLVCFLGPATAPKWLNTEDLSADTVAHAFVLIGLIVASQWPAALYAAGLQGLQRQIAINVVGLISSALRGAGGALALAVFEPTVATFLRWQLFVSVLQTLTLALLLWRMAPASFRVATVDFRLLRPHLPFAAGLAAVTLLASVLTQSDRIVLSKLVSLEAFGYYSFAVTVSVALSGVVQPVSSAVFPALTQLVVARDETALASLYHRACQLVAILVVPVTLWLAMFSRELLSVWIGDDMTVAHTYRLVAVLALGTGLNCVMTMPYTAQLAHGWTALSVTKNVVAVAVVIPAMFFLISIWGELGAAATWALLNAGYVVFEIPAMHRRILRSEARRWYIVDVAVPIGLSVGVIGVARLLVAEPGVAAAVTMWASLPVSILVLGVVLPQPRAWLVEYVSRSVGPR